MTKAAIYWALIKPVIIVVIAGVGWFFTSGLAPKLFLAIIILSIIFRGGSIGRGFVAIYNAILGK